MRCRSPTSTSAVGEAKCALVVGVECLSRFIDWTDRGTCVLFGDGAGAVVLTPADEPGIVGTHLHSDGKLQGPAVLPVRRLERLRDASQDNSTAGLKMHGHEVFKVAVRTLSKLVDETLAKNGIERSEVDWLIPHQANLRIIQSAADKLGLPMEKVVVTVQDHGNTSAASIPLAWDTAVRDGRIHRGQMLLLETFGGGFTWGSR